MSLIVEKRREIRNVPAEPVDVVVLGEGPLCMLGQVLDMSSHGMALQLPSSVPAGSAIKIGHEDALILGEVSYCLPQGSGYRAGLIVKHRLAGLAALHRLNRALRDAPLAESTASLIMKE